MSRFPLLYLARNTTFAYVTPHRDSYHLLQPFYMPTDQGPQWSIALSDKYGSIFAGGLTLVFALIFSYIWDFIAAISILFVGNRKLRRYVGLLSVWNAGDPWSAFKQLTKYAYHSFHRDPNDKLGRRGWFDFFYGLVVSFVALVVVLGAILIAVMVPSVIQNGNAAPVNRDVVYYPGIPEFKNQRQSVQQFSIKVPPVLRALSSATIARDAILNTHGLVTINETALPTEGTSGDPRLNLDYKYSLTGVELGLQYAPQLRLEVRGGCTTEYSWLDEGLSNATRDVYDLWNDSDLPMRLSVSLESASIRSAAASSFMIRNGSSNIFAQEQITGNYSYAIAVGSAYRSSITNSSDPWYATEPRPDYLTPAPHNAMFWIRNKRPVLSCWEKRTWFYNNTMSNNFEELRNNTSSHLAGPLLDVLEAALVLPMTFHIGLHAGDLALLCRTTNSRGVVDAERCSIRTDMERLIVASFVATHHIFTDSTLFKDVGDYPNVYAGKDKKVVVDGADGFVVRSPNVKTFSLVGIIVVASTLFGMIMLRFLGIWVLWLVNPRNNPWRQMDFLTARQLFRNLCERELGKSEKYWPCYSSFPVGEDERALNLVDWECKRPVCHGHIRHSHGDGRFSYGEGMPLVDLDSKVRGTVGSDKSLNREEFDDLEEWDAGSYKDHHYGHRQDHKGLWPSGAQEIRNLY
ncbi:hypothetical protein QBC44DRAFT_375357 [Cladorrhinum sp. PSN332]|nr:hypothetical protein QBC44DRAFT_375357 [Cladorrhinum sp. PSN332]